MSVQWTLPRHFLDTSRQVVDSLQSACNARPRVSAAHSAKDASAFSRRENCARLSAEMEPSSSSLRSLPPSLVKKSSSAIALPIALT
eukprot:CAMPEP_0119362030 /NCGR_PEP_ID=MMETSP1334-20130426/9211_1 /TAXON_ID=127549 /ORGANISM="Calcidiscus leptoporus, Strain RCC1130" /LENGTH=86 /DNA_ID=CAMNT_0007377187 /DNA_START=262 /DNA_END=525 /DNA_ORIENTATION=+